MTRHRSPGVRLTHRPAARRLPALAAVALGTFAAACGLRTPDPAADGPVRTAAAAASQGSAIDSVRLLLRRIAEQGVGIAVAVHRRDTALWVEGLGYADAARQRPVDPDETLFRIYSLSKPMTAVAGARLMETGRLDPGAPIQRYVPSFPEKDRTVTAMKLATHQAGIRHYRDGEARSRTHCTSVADALPIFAEDPLVPLEEGAQSYSSWGFVLLSAVLEAAAGEPFDELMARLVLDPAGMTHTQLGDPRSMYARATPLTEAGGQAVPDSPVDNSCKWGAGAYLATASDMARFGVALFDGTLLSPSSAQLLRGGDDAYRAQGVGTGGTAFLSSHAPSGTSLVLLANVSGETLGPRLQSAFAVMVDLFLGEADPADPIPSP
jgi:CubicO group peptidase (beta-lactamase class C family)